MKLSNQQLISFLDLTHLNLNSSPEELTAFAHKAHTKLGNVAAICVYANYLSSVQPIVAHYPAIKLAAVVNFPQGDSTKRAVCNEIEFCVTNGANEIDLVLPYQSYVSHQSTQSALDLLQTAITLVHSRHASVKVILETGAFTDVRSLMAASRETIDCGADFLKTSTGKISEGATPDKAKILLTAIQESKKSVGFKVSGGIRTIEAAQLYAALTAQYLGEDSLTAMRFRIGASSLLDELLA